MFSLVKNCQTVFQSGCAILHSHGNGREFLLLHISLAFGVVGILDFGHSNSCLAARVVVLACILEKCQWNNEKS